MANNLPGPGAFILQAHSAANFTAIFNEEDVDAVFTNTGDRTGFRVWNPSVPDAFNELKAAAIGEGYLILVKDGNTGMDVSQWFLPPNPDVELPNFKYVFLDADGEDAFHSNDYATAISWINSHSTTPGVMYFNHDDTVPVVDAELSFGFSNGSNVVTFRAPGNRSPKLSFNNNIGLRFNASNIVWDGIDIEFTGENGGNNTYAAVSNIKIRNVTITNGGILSGYATVNDVEIQDIVLNGTYAGTMIGFGTPDALSQNLTIRRIVNNVVGASNQTVISCGRCTDLLVENIVSVAGKQVMNINYQVTNAKVRNVYMNNWAGTHYLGMTLDGVTNVRLENILLANARIFQQSCQNIEWLYVVAIPKNAGASVAGQTNKVMKHMEGCIIFSDSPGEGTAFNMETSGYTPTLEQDWLVEKNNIFINTRADGANNTPFFQVGGVTVDGKAFEVIPANGTDTSKLNVTEYQAKGRGQGSVFLRSRATLLFVDPNAGDFRLQAGSVGKNGVSVIPATTPAPTGDDINRFTRTYPTDIGPYDADVDPS